MRTKAANNCSLFCKFSPLALICLLLQSASLFAADFTDSPDWEYSVDLYLWGADIGAKSPSGGDSTIDFIP